MFYRDSQFVYHASELDRFDWLLHGFGTRRSPALSHLATLKQIHSNTCVLACGKSGVLGEGDALLENTPGCVIAVKTADCMPILLVDETKRAVAAVHAGWRGTVSGIAGAALGKMRDAFGTDPENVHAAIGPGIGKCCYEVGPEVAAEFGETGRAHIDLPDANRRQLLAAGVPATQIYLAGMCTMCGGDEFESYRRDKERSGRMFAYAGVR